MQATLWEIFDASKGHYDEWCRQNGIDPNEEKSKLNKNDVEELRELLRQDAEREREKVRGAR